MKNYKKWFVKSITAVAVMGFVACSSSDDDPILPEFPEQIQSVECAVDATANIAFEANMAWQLSSGAAWCTLSVDGIEYLADVSGAAGSNNVLVKVSDAGQDFIESSADITLSMGGENRVIAKVVRPGKDYILALYSSDGNPMDSIGIASNGSVTFNVVANFAFAAVELPEWMDEPYVVTSDTSEFTKTYTLSVADAFSPFEQSGVISFADEQGNNRFDYRVDYSGMDAAYISVSGNNSWHWTVSGDGKTFTQANSLTGGEVVIEDAVPFTVVTRNFDCRYVGMGVNGDKLELLDHSWLAVTVDDNDASSVKITAEAAPADMAIDRQAYVFAVPAGVYDDFIARYNNCQDVSFIDSTQYVLFEATQKAVATVEDEVTFEVKHKNMYDVECINLPYGDLRDYLTSEYSLNEIYSISVDAGMPLTIYTHLTDNEWEGWTSYNVIAADVNGNSIDVADLRYETGWSEGTEEYYIQITTPENFNTAFVLVLKGVSGTNIKALVVNPN